MMTSFRFNCAIGKPLLSLLTRCDTYSTKCKELIRRVLSCAVFVLFNDELYMLINKVLLLFLLKTHKQSLPSKDYKRAIMSPTSFCENNII